MGEHVGWAYGEGGFVGYSIHMGAARTESEDRRLAFQWVKDTVPASEGFPYAQPHIRIVIGWVIRQWKTA